jgi:dolichol-phosphate mannosyltransferase
MRDLKSLSVVVPCHNDAASLAELVRRIRDAVSGAAGQWEIVLVNDGSTDETWEVIERLHSDDPRVKGVDLSRNFGQQAALTAGIESASGDAVLTMDSDLQDPPEQIPEFIRRWRDGYDVVHGVRDSREGDSAFKAWAAGLFYRLLRKMSGSRLPDHAGDFRLMDRRVADAFLRARERHRYVKGLVAWMGFRQTTVACRRPSSARGSSGYGFLKLLSLSFDAIAAFSVLPLRAAFLIGLLLFAGSFVGGAVVVFLKIFKGISYRGWPSLFVALSFFSGVQLLFLGVLGEYVGRVYEEVKQRPLYVVGRFLGVGPKGAA